MKMIFKLIVVSLFASIVSSCTQEVGFDELNIHFIDRIVVDGMITTEMKEQKVFLYHSSDINSGDNNRMETGANVSITDGDTTVILTEKDYGEYATTNNFTGKINRTYTLNIKLKNGKEYSASSFLYPSMIVDTLFTLSNGQGYDLFIKVRRTDGVEYMYDVYLNDSLLNRNLREKVNYEGLYYDNLISIPNSLLTKDSSLVQVCLYSISYQMYQYIYDIGNETWWSSEMFRTTQSNVRTNISNDGLGYFSASDVLRKQILIVKK